MAGFCSLLEKVKVDNVYHSLLRPKTETGRRSLVRAVTGTATFWIGMQT
jgi:hypothetical protein